ncbi:hypothetical protein ACFWPU_44000 [Streptomyces sp. NPDC058471]|uniref:hypothetical protein n=1 Tax=Streptomyces sp. NPDC058471 TaxID=3346516 RepID=UPI0036676432
MSRSFNGAEFLQALASDTVREKPAVIGMVKKSEEGTDSVQFAPGTTCQDWTTIPVGLIDRVELLRQVPCDDHTHSLVQLTLKESDSPEHAVLATLLAHYSRISAAPTASPCGTPAHAQPPPQGRPQAQLQPQPQSQPPRHPRPHGSGAQATGAAPLTWGVAPQGTPPETTPRAQADCVDGSSACVSDGYGGFTCLACCHGYWNDIGPCLYGKWFSCNGVNYNAYNCWPIA